MSQRHRTVWIVALGIALALPLAAAAARRPAAAAPGSAAMFERAARRLELTATQKEEIKAILRAHRGELESELRAVKAARQKLWEAIHATSPDDAAIRAAAAGVGRAAGELGITRAEIVQEVRAVLTAEQQAELAEMADDLRAFLEALAERFRGQADELLGG